MGETGNANWIDGRWTRSRGGGRFEVCEARPPWAELGSWPSSGPVDADLALSGLRATELFEEDPGALRATVLAAAGRLERDLEGTASLARRLGLREAELALHRTGLVRAARSAGAVAPFAAGTGEVAVVAAHWSELLLGPLRAAARELARGRAVLLVGDPRAPMASEAVARALLEAGLPSGALALLQGLTLDGLSALLAEPRVRSVHAWAGADRVRWLRRAASTSDVPEQHLRLLRTSAFQVELEDDVTTTAEEVVERAFGRARALSGQRGGQVGRVFCDQHLFSSFTEELLGALARSEAGSDPIPMIDRVAAEGLRRAWAAGLDQGATLIAGGTAVEAGAEERRGELRLLPTVFTNVEPRMQLARRQAPMPIVCLIRTVRRATERQVATREGEPPIG